MFEAIKNLVITVMVWVQTGMGPNYVFNNTKEMADFSRAWLDAFYTVEDFVSILPELMAGIIMVVALIVMMKVIISVFKAED